MATSVFRFLHIRRPRLQQSSHNNISPDDPTQTNYKPIV